MDDGHRESDMSHPLTAHAFLRHFDAATVARDPLVADPLVLPAMAFPIADRSENLLTKESILFGTEGAIVDRFWLCHLAMRAGQNHIRRCQADDDLGEGLSC